MAEIAEPEPGAQGSAADATKPHAVRPRHAASMVLIDRSGPEPKVLLGRRNAALKFLPSKYAFPGGRLEPDDKLMASVGTLQDRCIGRLGLRRPRGAPPPHAFALAAIRELYEETGLLLGAEPQAAATLIPPAWQSFVEYGFAPNLGPLRFFARAVTPPAFPRRFDTSFFLLDVSEIAHRIEDCITAESELVELVWVTPEEGGKHDIPVITAMILLELAARLKDDFPEHLPVPFFYERQRRWIREELA